MGIIITAELLETIDNYLKGELSEMECSNFEKQINENKEFEEIVLIQKKLFEINNFDTKDVKRNVDYSEDYNHYKQQLMKKENQKLFAKISEIGRKENQAKYGKKRGYLKYYIAASIAIFFSIIFLLTSNSSLDTYYYDNVNWEELPSFVSKEQSLSDFTKGETFFKNNEYEKAILTFSTIKSDNELYPYSLMYIGASYDKLNRNDEALHVFDKLLKLPNFEEYSRGYWYKLLIYLKENNRDKAVEIRNIILKNNSNFNYEKAKNLKL
jgi:tetratricopeptide (TPR) repeat protein